MYVITFVFDVVNWLEIAFNDDEIMFEHKTAQQHKGWSAQNVCAEPDAKLNWSHLFVHDPYLSTPCISMCLPKSL